MKEVVVVTLTTTIYVSLKHIANKLSGTGFILLHFVVMLDILIL